MANYFNETQAQSLLSSGKLDDCIVYAMCCIPPTLAMARLKYPYGTQWDDLEGEYQVYLVQAIQRYNPEKKTRLFSWITTYLRYAEWNFVRRESEYFARNVQLNGDTLVDGN